MVMQNRLYFYWNRERVMQNVLTFYLNRERIIWNGILGISVGAYCIRPLKTSSRETYDQKSMYMWGVCNTPLLWRQKGSIPKINFLTMRIVMGVFFDLKNGYAKLYDLLFESKNYYAELITHLFESNNSYAKWHDPFFDQTETYAKCIDLLFESRKGCAKWHDLFFDQTETYAKCIDLLFESRKGCVKRHIGYFCRGVLHTPPQCILKRNVWSEIQVHVGRMQYAPTLTEERVYF